MPKNKKRDSSDSDSGPEDRGPAKKSKPSKSSKNEDADEEPSWSIDKRRMVKVREFRGKWMIDIREYYESDGELKPGKKGIALSLAQWNKLKDIISEVDEVIKKSV